MKLIIIALIIVCIVLIALNIYVYKKPYKQGPQGDKGKIGEIGLRGEIGFQGVEGEKGVTGLKGEKGNRLGLIGEEGSKGYTGKIGRRGQKGYTGLIGEKGNNGIQGLNGDKGYKGKSGKTGFQGPELSKNGYPYEYMPDTCEWINNLECPKDKVIINVSGEELDIDFNNEKHFLINKVQCCSFDLFHGAEEAAEAGIKKATGGMSIPDFVKSIQKGQ